MSWLRRVDPHLADHYHTFFMVLHHERGVFTGLLLLLFLLLLCGIIHAYTQSYIHRQLARAHHPGGLSRTHLTIPRGFIIRQSQAATTLTSFLFHRAPSCLLKPIPVVKFRDAPQVCHPGTSGIDHHRECWFGT